MTDNPRLDRRSVLKALGVAGALGGVDTASALPPQQSIDDLRLFGQAAANNAMEVVTDGTVAYVATGDGMAVVDWANPGRPEPVATVDLHDHLDVSGDAGIDVLDVKVDGNVAILANDEEIESPGGIAMFDVSDPSSPQFLSFYEPVPAANIHNAFLDGKTAYLGLSEPRFVEDEEGLGIRLFGETGVEIVDLDDPANPAHAATWKLKEEFPAFANSGVSPNHDLYAQDGLLYNAFWDAGVVVLDVSDPTDPEFVAQFGEAPEADTEIRPFRPAEESIGAYFGAVFPFGRYLGSPGNAHYVQPSPDGEHLFVGAETFVGGPGGIRVFDVSDLNSVEAVADIEPPDGDSLRTAHNFDVTSNRLVSSWYNGGVRVHDVTDPTAPTEIARYRPDDIAFWTAVEARGFVVGGVYGARSDASDGGIVVLNDDRGEKRPPSFEGSAPPDGPAMKIEPGEE